MKKKKTLTLLMIAAILSSCSTAVTDYSYLMKHSKITEEKLADGSTVKVGMVVPEGRWDCKNLGQKSYNWSWIKTKNMDYLPSSINTLKSNAISDADKEHLKPNYISLIIPDEVSVGRINATVMSDATATYYNCKDKIPTSVDK